MRKITCKNFEELPFVLTVDQIGEILGICRKLAYEIVKTEGLALRVGEKRLVVPRERFLDYLKKKEVI
ncbi:MAG: helix-turn-helix domain-containing protein [Bacillota bacterium]